VNTVAETKIEKQGLIRYVEQYEYEIILLVFLLLRFIFKNILFFKEYFTKEPIFGFSDTLNIVIGIMVVIITCIYLSYLFGQIIKINGPDYESSVIFIVALFFACPASLPFLFDVNSLSGTQMLYPFALFTVSVFLITKPIVKWFIPLICAIYFVPSVYTSEFFFLSLRKGAILYVPLLLLFLFLDMMRKSIKPNNKNKKQPSAELTSSVLFRISFIVSVGAYIYTIVKHMSNDEIFHSVEQKLNWYFLVCLLLIAPALCVICIILYKAVKNSYAFSVFSVFIIAPLLLLPLSKNNYYSIWIPFLILSLFLLVFYSIWQKNPAILSAVRIVGDYLSGHKFVFYIILITMASFSNVSSNYLSDIFQKLFSTVPY
jgi:hypothetical protein